LPLVYFEAYFLLNLAQEHVEEDAYSGVVECIVSALILL
jgi:hypothetical protein